MSIKNPKKRIAILAFCSFCFCSSLHAATSIADPNISARCRALLDSRSHKVELVQKAQYLKTRVTELKHKTPPKKITKQKKLEYIDRKLGQKLQILGLEITRLEEDIVRKGCPGIKL